MSRYVLGRQKWISLLFWIGTDPRLAVDDLEMDGYKRARWNKRSVRAIWLSGKKANIDPKRDNILSRLNEAG
jgi:hypothetical protein